MQQTHGTDAAGRFRTIRAMCAAYLIATAVTLAFMGTKSDDHGLVTDHAWGHEVVLLIFAVLLVLVARRAAAGHRRAYLRLRIIAVVVPVASLTLALIPGFLPGWMRVEQVVYGLWLLGVAALAHSPAVRRSFAED